MIADSVQAVNFTSASPSNPAVRSESTFKTFVGTVVYQLAGSTDLSYWVEVPATDHYDLGLYVSTNDTGDTVAIKVDGVQSPSSVAIPNTGGVPGAPVMKYTAIQNELLMAGYHQIDLIFAGSLSHLEFASFFLLPDRTVPATSFSGQTGGVGTQPDSYTIWGIDAQLNSSNQSITIPVEAPAAGIYQVEIRSSTLSSHADVTIQVDGQYVTAGSPGQQRARRHLRSSAPDHLAF